MSVKHKVKETKTSRQIQGDRLLEVVELRPATADEARCETENLARGTAIASERALRRIWDTPEEDEAWQNL